MSRDSKFGKAIFVMGACLVLGVSICLHVKLSQWCLFNHVSNIPPICPTIKNIQIHLDTGDLVLVPMVDAKTGLSSTQRKITCQPHYNTLVGNDCQDSGVNLQEPSVGGRNMAEHREIQKRAAEAVDEAEKKRIMMELRVFVHNQKTASAKREDHLVYLSCYADNWRSNKNHIFSNDRPDNHQAQCFILKLIHYGRIKIRQTNAAYVRFSKWEYDEHISWYLANLE
ncbi:hypothetical protein HDU77_005479 [Chytriomyces hyalinus]|nr:hypothetical protein HDU77_005479 [Chytriomyces hyalinus]